jgi:putative multicomponent Na+:H+ antiporter subunit B
MDSYVYIITALLPLAAALVVFQSNPYHALLMRGVLGAIAVLVYTVLGAPDVALTEALVGTLLAITLYAIAVRSSLVLRLGVLQESQPEAPRETDIPPAGDRHDPESNFQRLIEDLQTIFGKRHMRVELVPYLDRTDLHQALMAKEIHATCAPSDSQAPASTVLADQPHAYHTTIRLRRLYEIMQAELTSSITHLTYMSASDSQEKP